MLDFNNAPAQQERGLIPEDTIVPVQISVRPGNAGDGGWLKRSKAGDSEALDLEMTILEGQYATRKVWALLTLKGVSEGHEKAGEISAGKLRGLLESARGINPDDKSEAAQAARHVNSWGDFDGLRCLIKIGVEKGTDGYKDKNVLDVAITPERKEWRAIQQVKQAVQTPRPSTAPGNPTAQAGVLTGKPSWAQ